MRNKFLPGPTLPAYAAMVALLLTALVSGCTRDGRFMLPSWPGQDPADRAIEPGLYFSVNAITPFHRLAAGEEDVWETTARQLDIARDAGATTIRIDMWWGALQDGDGEWDFTASDMIFDLLEERGLKALPILCYNGPGFGETAILTEENRKAFGEYVHQMVTRYRDRVRWWQVWNEPNIEPFWTPDPSPELYTLLLREVAMRAREADPAVRLVGMNTAGADISFIEACYRHGAGEYIDAVAFHHYNAEADESLLDEEVRNVRRAMDRHGDIDKPILITEFGLSTGPSPVIASSTPEFQASWMVKKHLVARAGGVSQAFWFKLMDDVEEPAPDGYWGLLKSDFTPKPSAHAYRVMTEQLDGLRLIGQAHGTSVFSSQSHKLRVYILSDGETTTAVAWMEQDHREGAIRLPATEPVRVLDLYGDVLEEIAPRNDGLVLIQLDEEPRYIEGLGNEALALVSLHLSPSDIHLSPGQSREVQLSYHNPLSQSMLLDFSRFQDTPPGLEITVPEPVKVRPGRTWRGTMVVSLAADAPEFRRMVLKYNEDFRYTYSLQVNYQAPLDITMGVEQAGTQVRIIATVENLTEFPLDGMIDWRINGASRADVRRPFDTLQPREIRAFYMEFDVWPGENLFTFEIDLEDGARRLGRFPVWGQQITKEAPKQDGSLAVWNRQPHVVMLPFRHQFVPEPRHRQVSASESSARVYTAWTETHMHLALDVTDPTPNNNPFEGREIWKGDSMEFFMGFSGPGSKAHALREGDFQFGLSPGSGLEVHTWNWRSLTAEDEHGAPLKDVESSLYPTDEGWLIKASIPISEFGLEEILPYTLIGFDMHLNNRHGFTQDEIRETSLIWNGDTTNWRTPARWGAAMILPDPVSLPTSSRSQLANSKTPLQTSDEPTTDPDYLTPIPVEFPHAARHLPDWLELDIPWEGEFLISTGYGYESRSWTHQTIGNDRSANDFFCLDADLPVGHPVLAMAPGRIISSTHRMDSYGKYVVIDHGEGYHSIYAHLDSLVYHVHLGEPEIYIDRGGVIGRGGSTGTSWPHLHFGVHFNARQSHSGANVGGEAVVPEPLGGYYGIRRGHELAPAREE
ncbi:MAG: peptidoglycan DD-metalloendopeptidase family protein [Candidatus Sumerlaeia bacterium]|nr:peptidoglycan DD-metalloendopeptidase family protein [Candidatus Sumerlaeia bacterium]